MESDVSDLQQTKKITSSKKKHKNEKKKNIGAHFDNSKEKKINFK